MGALQRKGEGQIMLSPEHLVGRSKTCDLQLTDPSISSRQASLRWANKGWDVQDLGSRNGTHVDGKQIEVGVHAPLVIGSEIRFGDDAAVWVMVDVAAPGPMVVSMDGAEIVQQEHGVLALPNDETPEVTIHRASGGWVLEGDGGVQLLENGMTVNAGGQSWRFWHEGSIHTTAGTTRARPANIRLEIAHSLNEEHVELLAWHRQRKIPIPTRERNYLLLTLARERIADQQGGELEEADQGWIDQERLIGMLGLSSNQQLNMDVFRVRKEFDKAGIVDAAQVVERRGASKELRIGVAELTVRAL